MTPDELKKIPVTKGLRGDEFLGLMEVVEDDGGALLPGICRGAKIHYKVEDPLGRQRTEDHMTTGCGNEARFVLPYKSFVQKSEEGTLTVCAVDDAMHLWPKYKKRLKEAM